MDDYARTSPGLVSCCRWIARPQPMTFVRPLDSGGSTVDNQVIAEYITTLIRSQKERCRSNFLRTAKSANRNDGLEPLTSSIRLLFRSKLTINDRSFNHTRANEVCTNLPVLQFCSPSAHVGAQRRLGGGVGAIARIALQPNTRPDKNHGATVIQDRQSLLNGEPHATGVSIECLVKVLGRDRGCRLDLHDSRIGDHNIQFSFCRCHLFIEAVQII